MIFGLKAICLTAILLTAFGLRAEDHSRLNDKDAEAVRRIVREEVQRQADLERVSRASVLPQKIDIHLDPAQSNSPDPNLWVPFLASILTSLLALGGVLLSSRNTVITTLRTLDLWNKLKHQETVIDALKFFGNQQGTQSRGVGIAVIRANID